MRDIKFRGKRVDNGEWVYGDLIHAYNFSSEAYDTLEIKAVEKYQREVDTETVGEYIGLKDKNKIEIFKGDIVLDNVGRKWIVDYSDNRAGFIFRWYRDKLQYQDYKRFNREQRPLEVIGNIHKGEKK